MKGHVIAKPKNQRKLFAAIEHFLSTLFSSNKEQINTEENFSNLFK